MRWTARSAPVKTWLNSSSARAPDLWSTPKMSHTAAGVRAETKSTAATSLTSSSTACLSCYQWSSLELSSRSSSVASAAFAAPSAASTGREEAEVASNRRGGAARSDGRHCGPVRHASDDSLPASLRWSQWVDCCLSSARTLLTLQANLSSKLVFLFND